MLLTSTVEPATLLYKANTLVWRPFYGLEPAWFRFPLAVQSTAAGRAVMPLCTVPGDLWRITKIRLHFTSWFGLVLAGSRDLGRLDARTQDEALAVVDAVPDDFGERRQTAQDSRFVAWRECPDPMPNPRSLFAADGVRNLRLEAPDATVAVPAAGSDPFVMAPTVTADADRIETVTSVELNFTKLFVLRESGHPIA